MKKLLPLLFLPGMLIAEDESPADEVAFLEPTYLEAPSVASFESPTADVYIRPRKSAFLAATMSGLLPGLGHAYLGDLRTSGALFATYETFRWLRVLPNTGSNFHRSNLITKQNVGSYSVYAAYRDARAYNNFEGYNYPMPNESGLDLVLASFQWSVLQKPEVWGGFLGALTVATTVSYFVQSDADCSSEGKLFPLLAFPVGIGEEALYRGYLQSALSEGLTPVGGIALSSLLFGAAHLPNGLLLDRGMRKRYFTYSIPMITAFGAYFGWVTYKNQSLKESVAVHSWYDFTLFLASYSAASSAAIGSPAISFSFSF